MARRPVVDDATSPLAELFAEHVARPTGGSRRRSSSSLETVVGRVEFRIREGGGWDGGRDLVGLYAWCHRSVYQVLPVELEGEAEFRAASRAATSMLHAHFGDDVDAAVAFVKWSWQRERGRAEWARRNQRDRNRMGWRLQFSARHVTDYRAATAGRR